MMPTAAPMPSSAREQPILKAEVTPQRRPPDLTRRDRQILKLMVEGCTNEQIGRRLHLGTQTVKNGVSALMEKVAVRNRVQLAVYAVRARLD